MRGGIPYTKEVLMIIDAFGKACPMPLVMAKKELDKGCRDLQISVDNETALANLTRLSVKYQLDITVEDIEGGYLVSFSDLGEHSAPLAPVAAAQSCNVGGSTGCGYAVFIGKECVGEGDPVLGGNLMKMALYTFAQADVVPASLLFMNAGVTLVAGEEDQIIESIEAMMEKGTEVLVCGTCLDFYHLKDSLKIGDVSNMYDILERMHEAAKVITL